MLRGMFIALNAYVTEEKRSKISNLCFYLGKVEKEKKLTLKQAEENK